MTHIIFFRCGISSIQGALYHRVKANYAHHGIVSVNRHNFTQKTLVPYQTVTAPYSGYMKKSFDSFKSRFIEEARDNIDTLEKALLQLEEEPSDQETLNLVFRCLHSLKGSGGMFGFHELSEFTHDLENLYDLIRGGHLTLSPAVLSTTLQSIDILRLLTEENISADSNTQTNRQQLKQEISLYLKEYSLNKKEGNIPKSPARKKPKTTTYYIHFSPSGDILSNGLNLLYLMDDLNHLGKLLPVPVLTPVPEWEELKPGQCYTIWNLLLSTEKEEQEILDVFLFVADNSKIEINQLSGTDFGNDKKEIKKLTELLRHPRPDVSAIQKQITSRHPAKPGSEAPPSSPNVSKPSLKSPHLNTIRVASGKIDELIDLISELTISHERLSVLSQKYDLKEIATETGTIQKLVAQLRDTTLNISMIPIETITIRLQRLVRDLARDLEKEVTFRATGVETELDKLMIEHLADPLMHIVRNCVDHGIEKPEKRIKDGKSSTGSIHLSAFYSGTNVIIEVKDDGQGIDPDIIREKAIAKGVIQQDDLLSDQELLNLIFLPGFSTCQAVSEISGRGVGMDVVKQNINAIRGHVDISSLKGKGTKTTIHLPLVLSIVDALLFRIGNNQFILPVAQVEKIVPAASSQIKSGWNNSLFLNGTHYSFFDIRAKLSLPEQQTDQWHFMIINVNGIRFTFPADHIFGKIQAVLKPLEKLCKQTPFISAVTLIGDGSIALALDPEAIIAELSLRKNEGFVNAEKTINI